MKGGEMSILEKIDNKINQFHYDFSTPIAIYLGNKEYYEFRRALEEISYHSSYKTRRIEYQGIPVFRVEAESHFNVA